MNQEELNEIIRLHGLWLRNEEGGERADLRNADLRGANLSRVNLRYASLIGANLQAANLEAANLEDAYLRDANLKDASLQAADLRGAVLRGANLQGVRLWDTLLDCAVGIEHYSIGWHGHGENGRTLRAVRVNGELVFYCGCFRGSVADLREFIERDCPALAPSRLRALEIILELHEETK